MRTFTDTDIAVMQQAVTQVEGLIIDGDIGLKNGALIGEYFNNNTIPITTDSVNQAVTLLKSQLSWKSKLQIDCDRVAAPMSADDVNQIVAWIKSRGLKSEGDDLLQNFVVIGGWLVANNRTVSYSEMDLSLKYLQGKQEWARLRFHQKLQDSEIEAKRRKGLQSEPPVKIDTNPVTTKVEKTPLVGEPTLSPYLKYLRDLNHETPTEEKPKDDSADWKQLAEDVLQNTRSHVVREKARKIMFANNGVPDWREIYHARRRLIEQSGIR